MRIIRFLWCSLAIGWFAVSPASAQTAITETTTSAAVSSTDVSVALTSDTGVAAGTYLYIDKELMQATSEIGTTARWNVRRGLADGGTPAIAHASGAHVWVMASGATGESYVTYDATSGAPCTSTDYAYRPFINTRTGGVWDCEAGIWVQRRNDPVRVADYTVRETFDGDYFVFQDDMTAKSVTDDEDNVVLGSPLGHIEYREELTKTTSSWITTNGQLDLSADDTTDNEGVELVFGTAELGGWIVAGTSGGCLAASITVADISGTDQVQIGFRNNAALPDLAAYASLTVWNSVGINATDGSIVSSQEVSEATDTDDSAVNWADGETRALKVCVTEAGVPTAFYSNAYTYADATTDYPVYNAITMTETGSTLTATTVMAPFLSYLAAGTDGADVTVNWVQLMRLP